MKKSYTIFNENSITGFRSLDADLEAIDFLKNPANFRPFAQGLTELLEKKKFQGNLNHPAEKAAWLWSRLCEIQSSIEKDTVYAWFRGVCRPKIEPGSRRRMYELCFSLHLSYEETVWFFHHVYFDRCFNCRTVEEAVFCFCLLHDRPYEEALRIIQAAASTDAAPKKPKSFEINYTRFIQNQIFHFQTTEQFMAFLLEHRPDFNAWNNSASETIQALFLALTGDAYSKPVIDRLKRTLYRRSNASVTDISVNDIQKCGLLIQELYADALHQSAQSVPDYILDAIGGKNTFTNTFVLDRLLSSVTGLSKNPDIPYVVRNNFPSKKVLSDILNETKVSTSRSYDAIRKTLVLLDFYVFWLRVKLGITKKEGYGREELAQIYRDEADTRLYRCGYEPLFAGNPYDWIFLCSVQNEDPPGFFRSLVAGLMEE